MRQRLYSPMDTRFVYVPMLCLLTLPAIASEPDTYNQLPVSPLVKPILPLATTVPPPENVEWKPLIAQSLRFLFLEHAFRYATSGHSLTGATLLSGLRQLRF
jgi:hypothetical protein